MKWKTKNHNVEFYDSGEECEWIRYAWLPTKATDGNTYWLTYLKHKFRCSSYYGAYPHPSKMHDWTNVYKLLSILPLDTESDE